MFVYDNVVYVMSWFMPVGCGWPGPGFGPAVLYSLVCGGGCTRAHQLCVNETPSPYLH